MAVGSVGTVWVDVRFNVGDAARQLQAALAGATAGAAAGAGAAAAIERSWTQSLGAIGATAVKTGKAMTVGLTVPLALIGKAATSAYHDFDQAMTQITAINEVPIATTNQWRESVRDLGLEYGVAAEEAAQGLYFITSSGVQAADAMQVLEVAIKGSAVGLGETKVVADVLTSALSAYGKENITAAEAADQLTAAVKLGKGEADDLAGSLSQVIPIAANLGVSFGEVSGAMAAMTLSGTSSDQAATQLRGLFNTLQDMPPVAQKALKQYTGLDYAATRLALKNEGLVPTLKAIYDGFGENTEAMAEVFGNIRALTGVFNLFGKNTEQTLAIIESVTNASGELGAAWEKTAESDAKKLDRAMNSVHDSMVELGADVIPVVTGAVGVVGKLGAAFGELPDPLQNTAVGFAAVAAAAGPAMLIFGKMAQGFAGLGRVIGTLSPTLAGNMEGLRLRGMYVDDAIKNNTALTKTFGSLNTALAAGTAALAVGAAAWGLWAASVSEGERVANEARQASKEGGSGGIGDARKQMEANRATFAALKKDFEDWDKRNKSGNLLEATGSLFDIDAVQARAAQADALGKENERMAKNIDLAEKMARATGQNADAFYVWIDLQESANHTYATSEEALKAYNEALAKNDEGAKKVAQSSLKASNSIGGIIAKAKGASDAFFGLVEAEDKAADAQKGLDDARKRVTDAEEAYRQAKLKTLDADRQIAAAQRKAVDATNKVRDARLALADAERELQDARRGPSEDERLDLESAQIAVQEAQKAARGKFDDPLDRRKAQIDLRRAQLDLERIRGEHAERVADAEKGVADAQQGVNDAVQAEIDAQDGIVSAREAKAQASKDEAAAFDAIAAAHDGVKDAEYRLYQANVDLAGTQDALNTAIATGVIKGDEFRTMLDKLREMYPQMSGVLDGYAKKFGDIFNANKPADPYGGARPASDRLLNRASGGPLSAGQASNINERGMPELWSAKGKQYLLPTTNGQVTPLKPLDVNVQAKGGDGVSIGDIYVQGAPTPVATAYELRRQIRAKGI